MAAVLLTLERVTKQYRFDHSKVDALCEVSLSIRRGEFIAIMGPSGSGKSTLLRIMGGLDQPTKGTISFEETNIGRLGDNGLSKFRNKYIGFVAQEAALISYLTVEENIASPLFFAVKQHEHEEPSNLLREVGLTHHRTKKPHQLSGGQAARTAIARALIMRPPLLLADEPTGNLDTETGHIIISLLKTLQKAHGITCVIATHDKEIADAAHRVIHLKDGLIKK